MIRKRYVWLLVISLIIVTSFTVAAFNAGGEPMEQRSISYTPFKVYYPYYNQLDLIVNKTVEIGEIEKWVNGSIIPVQDEATGAIISAHTNNGVEMDIKNLEILFDKAYLLRHLNENLKTDIDAYWIMYMNSFIDGYIVIVSHNDTLSFMPVLSGHETYGGFADKTIYSWDEFAKLCEPKECTLIVNEVTIECDQPPIMHYGLVKFPLRGLLENLGFVVDWDGATESVIFSKGSDIYSYGTNKSKNPTGNILKNGVSKAGGTCSIVNGRTMVDGLFIQFLVREFNINIEGDANTHTVIVTNK